MKRKVIIFILFFLFFTLNTVYSDDGSWNSIHSELKGNLYSNNNQIIMEKEVLIFDGFEKSNVTAIFQFKNSSDKPLNVEAGFPVKFRIMLEPIKDGKIVKYHFPVSKYGPNRHFEIIKLLIGDKLKSEDVEDIETSNEYFLDKDIAPRRKVLAKDFKNIYNLKILQNNKNIDYDFVVIDIAIKDNYFEAVFHYHHNLYFNPNETSIVSVSYTDYCEESGEQLMVPVLHYKWNYIIGTGGTWKDNIKKLYFLFPEGIDLEYLPKELSFNGIVRLGENSYNLYVGENYKPKINDMFTLKMVSYKSNDLSSFYNYIWFTDPRKINIPSKSYYNVKYITTSSFIKQKTNLYTDRGVIEGIDFSGLRLFDGVKESVWCEGK
ncbi:MAG TPA: hypothetical protein PKW55_06040 [Spirochaetota bacterium]|nr:hypothetical protein [Spirochaetota bacterium]HOM38443.1 hypothetical protein [Spirochaetota bacterium]HPQ48983.1 hypothetical protein [Spirochaetota bacterium]